MFLIDVDPGNGNKQGKKDKGRPMKICMDKISKVGKNRMNRENQMTHEIQEKIGRHVGYK